MVMDKGFFPIVTEEQYKKMTQKTKEDLELRKKLKARAEAFSKICVNKAFK